MFPDRDALLALYLLTLRTAVCFSKHGSRERAVIAGRSRGLLRRSRACLQMDQTRQRRCSGKQVFFLWFPLARSVTRESMTASPRPAPHRSAPARQWHFSPGVARACGFSPVARPELAALLADEWVAVRFNLCTSRDY